MEETGTRFVFMHFLVDLTVFFGALGALYDPREKTGVMAKKEAKCHFSYYKIHFVPSNEEYLFLPFA